VRALEIFALVRRKSAELLGLGIAAAVGKDDSHGWGCHGALKFVEDEGHRCSERVGLSGSARRRCKAHVE
jgi:hypothetical protein